MDNRIITKPSIALIGKPQVLTDNLIAWLLENELATSDDLLHNDRPVHGIQQAGVAGRNPGSLLAEVGGRLCYNSFQAGREAGAWHSNIIDEKHGSVYGHGMYTFLIGGVSRTFTTELARHMQGIGYSQESQRYVSEDNPRFVAPPQHLERWAGDTDCRDAQDWLATQLEGFQQYKADLLEATEYLTAQNTGKHLTKRDIRKRAAEAARSSLPNSIETRLQWSCNLRAARHVMTMRFSLGADAEISRWASETYPILLEQDAPAFSDFTEYTAPDGRNYVLSRNGGI